MKFFFKVVLVIVIVLILIGIAQAVFGFDIAKLINSVKLSRITVNSGQENLIPVFQIVSLEVFFPSNIGLIEADVRKILGLEFGTVVLLFEYDSYAKFGVRNPQMIQIERFEDTLYVDESTIIIDLLDTKTNNYKYIRTFTSNFTVRPNLDDGVFLQALNEVNKELENRMIVNGQANFEFAKKNFMENYENMCNAMHLKVVWR
jgi:hypothetical protein